MKSQLASVFVIAAVACGGRGAEGSPDPAAGTTDVSQTVGRVPVPDDIEAPPATEAPIPIEHHVETPQPTENPIPVDHRGLQPQPPADPVPVHGTAAPQPNIEDWQARAPKRYVITTCGEGAVIPSCTVEAVDEGRLVSRSNRSLPSEPWASAPIDDGKEPVASLFEQAGLSIDGCTTSFELDPIYAYPSKIYFDCGQEGWGVRVTCFEPDTLDPSRCQ